MGILVIAEHDNSSLSASTLPTISAARQLGKDITLLIAGYHCSAVADAASIGEISAVCGWICYEL